MWMIQHQHWRPPPPLRTPLISVCLRPLRAGAQRRSRQAGEIGSGKGGGCRRSPHGLLIWPPASDTQATPAAALPLPYIVAALGNGFLAGVAILVTRTIFAKDPAKHYHFCFTASMLASLVFNRFLYGEWYTVQADKQARADKMCYGKKCVMMP
ncbi:hypothetical protein IOCL1545_000183600, partial [Leishmania shawi]